MGASILVDTWTWPALVPSLPSGLRAAGAARDESFSSGTDPPATECLSGSAGVDDSLAVIRTCPDRRRAGDERVGIARTSLLKSVLRSRALPRNHSPGAQHPVYPAYGCGAD